MIRQTIKDHKRIIFNGNGYDDVLDSGSDRKARPAESAYNAGRAALHPGQEKCRYADLAHRIFSLAEIQSRYEITLENYCKTVNIEALTMVDMARKEILPAVEAYAKVLSDTFLAKAAVLPGLTGRYEKNTIARLASLADEIDAAITALESALIRYKTIPDTTEAAYWIRDVILQKMAELRVVCDEAETLTAESYWPFPTYEKLLFGVK